MTKITRDIILDLLPLYMADEVSEDTRQLVESYMADDPKLAQLVETAVALPTNIPEINKKENEMKTFEKTKRLMKQQTIFLVFAIFTSLLFIAFRFDENGVEWLWQDTPAGYFVFAVATFFWIGYGNITYQLNLTDE